MRTELHSLYVKSKRAPGFDELSVALMRRLLGSIDHSDVEEPVSREAREARNAQIAAVYENILLPTLKRLSRQQEGFTARNAADWGQSIFGRGSINGIELIREHFENAFNEHKASSQQPEPPDRPHDPMPER